MSPPDSWVSDRMPAVVSMTAPRHSVLITGGTGLLGNGLRATASSDHVVDDVYENPLHNLCVARAVWSSLQRDISGVVHLAGRDVINRYDLARLVARIFELDASRVQAVPRSFFPKIAPRPANTSLVTMRMESELGMAPLAIEEGLRAMARERAGVEQRRRSRNHRQ